LLQLRTALSSKCNQNKSFLVCRFLVEITDEFTSRSVSSTLTLLSSSTILRQSIAFNDELVAILQAKIGAENVTAQLIFQPLPSYYGNFNEKNGGNVLGLDRNHFNAILWTVGVSVVCDDAAFTFVQAEFDAMMSKMKRFAEKQSGMADFVYMNYADKSQDPLGSYGPENVAFLREVAGHYDPEGWWQRRVPGGFKLSRVGG
jgi:hypothetical protein